MPGTAVFVYDGSRDIQFVTLAPDGMSREQARSEVDCAIQEVKERKPRDYQFEDVEILLGRKGFCWPATTAAINTM